jgi:hypothetical protein
MRDCKSAEIFSDNHLTLFMIGQVRVLKHDNKKAKNRLSFSSEYVQKTKSVMALIFTRASDFQAGLRRASHSARKSSHVVLSAI